MMSRGIDLNNIDCVINYDSPINERIFIHRAGRTARALNQGVLLSLLTKEEVSYLIFYAYTRYKRVRVF